MARLRESTSFTDFTFLKLNEDGRFMDGKTVVTASGLRQFFNKHMTLTSRTTDVFVWVHGWQNTEVDALKAARTLFPGIINAYSQNPSRYSKVKKFAPKFVAVHWPSVSSFLPSAYEKIRDRAKYMTEKGEAEYFLAQLLGYLNEGNEAPSAAHSRKLLAGKGGHFIHCIGHSFGGRFLTSAIKSAPNPIPSTKKLSLKVKKWPYTVDSLCVLQMAAPKSLFDKQFTMLATEAPITAGDGRIVLTWSKRDQANCLWHALAEKECAVGCEGAEEPAAYISRTVLKAPSEPYIDANFSNRIVNVDASKVFTKGPRLGQGAHGDIWHDETIHLLLTLVNRSRT